LPTLQVEVAPAFKRPSCAKTRCERATPDQQKPRQTVREDLPLQVPRRSDFSRRSVLDALSLDRLRSGHDASVHDLQVSLQWEHDTSLSE
jgi:hypothetical protein